MSAGRQQCSLMAWMDAFSGFFNNLSVIDGILLVLVIVFHRTTMRSYEGRLSERQTEIDRLAAENREYRDRFTRILDLNRDEEKR